MVLAAVAGGAQPPIGPYRRRLWNVLVPEDGDTRHRLYATEGIALEIVYLLGPVVIVGAIGAWSTQAGLVVCAAALLGGGTAFARHPAVRGLRGEPAGERDVAGALRAPGVVLALATFLTLGVTVGAVEVGVPATLETMDVRGLTGPVLGLWGLGSIVGGLAIARTGAPARPELRLALFVGLWGALHAALALASSPAGLALGITLAGATIAPTLTVLNGLLDRIALPGTLTEAFTWTSTGMALGIAAGGAIGGRLADAVSPEATLALGGSGLLGAALVLAGRAWLLGPPPAARPAAAV
jgi:predicted MFS family arabinose efflux permease